MTHFASQGVLSDEETIVSRTPQQRADEVDLTDFKTAPRAVKVWVLTNAPSPYQVELLNDAAQSGRLQMAVRFMRHSSSSGRAVIAAPAFEQRVMWGVLPEWCRDEVRLHPRAIWEVIRGGHDVYVLSGLYTSLTFFLCACLARLLRRRHVLWLERPHPRRKSGSLLRRLGLRVIGPIKGCYLRWLLRSASGVWCIGTKAQQEYQALGADARKTRVLPYCCNVERFCSASISDVEELRQNRGLVDRFVFLFSGQMIPRKGVDVLLQAFAAVSRNHPKACLLLLGDGAQRVEYEQLASQLGIADRVQFLRHRPQEELPVWFRLADVFVFPSRHDGWAVVINEACGAALPIIVSQQTGAAHDLVQHGLNGFLIDSEEVDAWVDRMHWCLEHATELPHMGEHSRQLVERFSSMSGAEQMANLALELLEGDKLLSDAEDPIP